MIFGTASFKYGTKSKIVIDAESGKNENNTADVKRSANQLRDSFRYKSHHDQSYFDSPRACITSTHVKVSNYLFFNKDEHPTRMMVYTPGLDGTPLLAAS